MIDLVAEEHGYTCPADPGEPTTSVRRISVTDQEADLLAFLAQGRRVLEIGTGLGVSTRAMARTARRVDTVDIDPWVHANVHPSLPVNVHTLTDRDQIYGRYGMAFIDADHRTDAVQRDIAFALTRIDRGIIVCHDAGMADVRAAMAGPWHVIDTYHGIGICYLGWDKP